MDGRDEERKIEGISSNLLQVSQAVGSLRPFPSMHALFELPEYIVVGILSRTDALKNLILSLCVLKLHQIFTFFFMGKSFLFF